MPKKATQKKFSQRLLNMGHANLAIVAAFMLVFVGLGAWFVNRSEAASGCVSQSLSQGATGTCVQTIESMLDHMHNYYGFAYWLKSGCPSSQPTCSYGYYDGIFGPKTKADVVRYQYKHAISGGNGVVGSRTWYWLCLNTGPSGFQDQGDYNRAGCSSIYGAY
jgi:putative peptidoglycan binding protein